MSLEIVRRIRGNLHGTIDLSQVEDAVVAHPIFQRLRRVRQTAMLNYVFPGATHTRFEHSLGVMKLASKAWTCLSHNQRRLEKNFYSKPQNSVDTTHGSLEPTFALSSRLFSDDYPHQVLRLAALLHDIGHPPYSHSGELFLPDFEEVLKANQDCPTYLKELFSNYHKNNKKISHEVFSVLLIHELFSDLQKNNPDIGFIVDPRDIIAVIWPEFGLSDDSPLKEDNVHYLLHEMISGELDVDRMDYLLRDSRECGVVYGIFDATRILDGLAFYYDHNDKLFHLALRFSALSAFEDYLRARLSMYLQVYFHKTSVSTEAMFRDLLSKSTGFSLPANRKDYWQIDEFSFEDYFLKNQRNNSLKEELYKLTRYRKLWKRVYEETSHQKINPKQAEEIYQKIISSGKSAQIISSSNSLTKLKSKKSDGISKNNFKLIKRNTKNIAEVVPIEDHSKIAQTAESVHIMRVYEGPHTKS